MGGPGPARAVAQERERHFTLPTHLERQSHTRKDAQHRAERRDGPDEAAFPVMEVRGVVLAARRPVTPAHVLE